MYRPVGSMSKWGTFYKGRCVCLFVGMRLCMYVCMYVCVCANFISRAVGAKPKARARAGCKIQRQRNQKHSKIIVRDCPMFQSLTIKMSRFIVLVVFLWKELTLGSQAACMLTTNSNSKKVCVSLCLYLCLYACMYACMCVRQFHFARRWGETASARTRKLQDPATA